jgi:hypothetical protein
MASTRKIALFVSAFTIASVFLMPTFAASASNHYQVTTDKKMVLSGADLRVIATVKQASPNCAYTVHLTVTGPGGVNAADTVTLNTEAGGNGHTAASFPADFSGTANTNTEGTYTVMATFACGYYSEAAAPATFTVFK